MRTSFRITKAIMMIAFLSWSGLLSWQAIADSLLFSVGSSGFKVNYLPSQEPQTTVKELPVFQYYEGYDSGTIACYANDPAGSVYSIPGTGENGRFYVLGKVQMKGFYEHGLFQPEGYEGLDLSKEQDLTGLCDQYFESCQGECWAGGDTLGSLLPVDAQVTDVDASTLLDY